MPVGEKPATVAVNVTVAPCAVGLRLVASCVVVGSGPPGLTTCTIVGESTGVFTVLPGVKTARTGCDPGSRVEVVHTAVRVLPAPVERSPRHNRRLPFRRP